MRSTLGKVLFSRQPEVKENNDKKQVWPTPSWLSMQSIVSVNISAIKTTKTFLNLSYLNVNNERWIERFLDEFKIADKYGKCKTNLIHIVFQVWPDNPVHNTMDLTTNSNLSKSPIMYFLHAVTTLRKSWKIGKIRSKNSLCFMIIKKHLKLNSRLQFFDLQRFLNGLLLFLEMNLELFLNVHRGTHQANYYYPTKCVCRYFIIDYNLNYNIVRV